MAEVVDENLRPKGGHPMGPETTRFHAAVKAGIARGCARDPGANRI